MAVSALPIAGVKRQNAGHLWSVTRRVTGDSAYVTGGEPIAASEFGLTKIFKATSCTLRAGIAVVAHVDPLVQTDGSILLFMRTADGAQLGSTENASTVVVDLTVEGY